MTVAIDFLDSDFTYPLLESDANEIAQFIFKSKSLIKDLNTFMRLTGGRDYLQNGQRWLDAYRGNRKKQAPDKIQLADLLEGSMNNCQKYSDWQKIRGLIPEKIFEQYFKNKHMNAVIGFGVIVSINNKKIIYNPTSNLEDDGPRRTVDAGSWNGYKGEFVEVKFRPEGFGTKEFGYLHLLERELDYVDAAHNIYLVTFDDASFTKKLFIHKGFIDESTRFLVIDHLEILNS